MGGWDAKPLGDLLVEFALRERARTALVAAGFHQARPFGEWKAAPEFRQTIEQMDEVEGRSQQRDRAKCSDGAFQGGNRFWQIQGPSSVIIQDAGELRSGRAQPATDRCEHVDE